MKRGKFFVFTGIDGSGISTISGAIAGADPSGVRFKTPGGILARVRDDIDGNLRLQSPAAHFLYYLASLAETSTEIARVLDSGRNVYSDRFLIDTIVSHRVAGVNVDLTYDFSFIQFPKPDLTFLIQVDEAVRQKRIQLRGKSALDRTMDDAGLRTRFVAEFERLSTHWIGLDNSHDSPSYAIEQAMHLIAGTLHT